jgi:C-5 cytosine-specific DNA methylase
MINHSASHTPLLSNFEMWSDNPWSIGTSTRPEKGRSGFVTLELCAGGGGQALGLENAGIDHVALLEIDKTSCETLRFNRPEWNVIEGDLHTFEGSRFAGADIVSGGLPCPPFPVAGKQLGKGEYSDMIRIHRQEYRFAAIGKLSPHYSRPLRFALTKIGGDQAAERRGP